MNRLKQIDEEINKLEKERDNILLNQSNDPNPEVTKFLNTYSGQQLANKHSMDEYGVWEIRGEDPNCDLGGSHHMPHLDTVEGKLIDAIKHAVSLSGFYQWGGGGDITKITIKNINKV